MQVAILAGLFFSAAAVFALESASNAPAAVITGKVPANETQLRDPFWPVGFVPPSVSKSLAGGVGGEQAEEIADMSNLLRIGGVVKRGDQFYVAINGVTVRTGEVVAAVADGGVYRFVVEEIDFKKVRLRPVKE